MPVLPIFVVLEFVLTHLFLVAQHVALLLIVAIMIRVRQKPAQQEYVSMHLCLVALLVALLLIVTIIMSVQQIAVTPVYVAIRP
jgi:hypothetical protein